MGHWAVHVHHRTLHRPLLSTYEVRPRTSTGPSATAGCSKAHCCEVIYAALSNSASIPRDPETYYRFGLPFLGTAERWCTAGIDYSGGSIGQGLSFAAGMPREKRRSDARANSRRADPASSSVHRSRRAHLPLYCILGEASSRWHGLGSAMFAAQFKLDNLIAIVDYKQVLPRRPHQAIMNLEPLVDNGAPLLVGIEIDGLVMT
jgi:transketolase